MFVPSAFFSLKTRFVLSTFAKTLVQQMYTRAKSALFVNAYHGYTQAESALFVNACHVFVCRNEDYMLTANKKRCFEWIFLHESSASS